MRALGHLTLAACAVLLLSAMWGLMFESEYNLFEKVTSGALILLAAFVVTREIRRS